MSIGKRKITYEPGRRKHKRKHKKNELFPSSCACACVVMSYVRTGTTQAQASTGSGETTSKHKHKQAQAQAHFLLLFCRTVRKCCSCCTYLRWLSSSRARIRLLVPYVCSTRHQSGSRVFCVTLGLHRLWDHCLCAFVDELILDRELIPIVPVGL